MPGGPLMGVVTSGIAGAYRLRNAQVAVFKEKEGWLVVGSKGGSATHPAWVVNMAHDPDRVWLQVGSRRLRVSPRSLEGAERGSAWKRIVSEAPNFGDYEKITDREIPVIELTPVQ
jgi:deazaflavin-dependent oxidoreductase (nitroreductase family)